MPINFLSILRKCLIQLKEKAIFYTEGILIPKKIVKIGRCLNGENIKVCIGGQIS